MKRPAVSSGEDFRLSSIAVNAFAPATLFGLGQGAIFPVIFLSSIDRGASTAVAALINALIGIGSLITNIPSGMLATKIGERRSMIVAGFILAAGLCFCLINIGTGPLSLCVYGVGALLIGGSGSVYQLARQSYLTEMVPVHMRARAMSTLGGMMRVGMFVGPFIGAGVMQLCGISGAYYVALGAVAIATLIVLGVPDLEVSDEHKKAASTVTTWGVVKDYRRMFLTLGTGVILLSAARQIRQVVIPLWAHHIGLTPSDASLIYGVAGGIDAVTFYPAGKVMDLHGRKSVAVPSMVFMAIAFLLMPLTHGAWTLVFVAMLMGFSNGIGSGVIMVLGADNSPVIGRPTFLGVWRELSDAGAGIGPLIFSGVTAIAGLSPAFVVSGGVGFAAALTLWKWIPQRVGVKIRAQSEPTLRTENRPAEVDSG